MRDDRDLLDSRHRIVSLSPSSRATVVLARHHVVQPVGQGCTRYTTLRMAFGSAPRLLIGHSRGIVVAGLTKLLANVTPFVEVVKDGRFLLEAAQRELPDVLIVELSMPHMHGLAATRLMRERLSDVSVVVMSLFVEPRLAAYVVRAGAKGFVLEHSAEEELVEAVGAVAGGRRYITPRIAVEVEKALAAMDRRAPERTFALTPRQRDVVRHIANGLSAKQVAAALGVSYRTVESHKYQAMESLGARTTTELVLTAGRLGMLPL